MGAQRPPWTAQRLLSSDDGIAGSVRNPSRSSFISGLQEPTPPTL